MIRAMKSSLKHIFRKIGPWSILTTSQVFVSVSVVNTMPSSRLSRQSTKVLIKVSIWTCLILVLSFLFIYTVLLICVDQQLQPAPFELSYKRIRLLGRMGNQNQHVRPHLVNRFSIEKSTSHRKAIWNSSVYFHGKESLPGCSGQSLITVLVTSSPENSGQRMAIRNTWCSPRQFSAPELAWKCIFLVGDANSEDRNSLVRSEMASYNDILLGSYIDSYRNLTLKVIHGLDWSTNYCPSSYVVKTDDDCFLNAALLHEFLVKYNTNKVGLYAGNVVTDQRKLKVIRGPEKKWSVRYEDYPEVYYPSYASGIGYVLSADVVKRLVSESVHIFPIPNEDAYVGIVVSQLHITPVSSNRFVLSSSGLTVCNFLYVFIVHNVKTDAQTELLKKAVQSRTQCDYLTIDTWS